MRWLPVGTTMMFIGFAIRISRRNGTGAWSFLGETIVRTNTRLLRTIALNTDSVITHTTSAATHSTMCYHSAGLQASVTIITLPGSRRLSSHPAILVDAAIPDQRRDHVPVPASGDSYAGDDHRQHHGIWDVRDPGRSNCPDRHTGYIRQLLVLLPTPDVGPARQCRSVRAR